MTCVNIQQLTRLSLSFLITLHNVFIGFFPLNVFYNVH